MAASLERKLTSSLPRRPPEACKILVVDDEPNVIEVISFHLERDGYQIIAAGDGKRALEFVALKAPDLIITDVMMPEVDGIELCRRIKGDPTTHFIPIIIFTARGDRKLRLEGIGAGADDFLDKPVDPLELSTRVRALLYTKQLHDELESHRQDLEKRVEERTAELKTAYERLKELDQLKADFIGSVSHELRTPLHQARTSVALLGEDLSPEKRVTVLEAATGAMDTLIQMIEDILALGAPTAPQIEPVSVAELIEEAIKGLRALPKRRDAKIKVNLPENLPDVLVERHGLTRVLHHLIDNGIKFSEGKEVCVSARKTKEGIEISIQDWGIGISEDQQRHLFEPFYQGASGVTRRYSGLGLGLTFVGLILDAHGIELEIASQEGKGTAVSLTLPLTKSSAPKS